MQNYIYINFKCKSLLFYYAKANLSFINNKFKYEVFMND